MRPPSILRGADGTDVPIQLEQTPPFRWWPTVAFLACICAAAVTATWMVAGEGPRGVFAGRIAAWSGWILLAPLVAACSARVLARRWAVGRAVAVHVLMFGACATWHLLLVTTVEWAAPGSGSLAWGDVAWRASGRDVEMSVLAYAAIVGGIQTVAYRRRLLAVRERVRELEGALVQVRLLTLQRQLQPHFLFNALNAIAGLMYRDVAAAEHALVTLGDLLRTTLERSGEQNVPLAAELDVVRAYLRLEQLRMEDPLDVCVVVEPGAERALVPTLLLQPLVENAVRHGVAKRRGAGRIEIRAYRDGRHLRLEVQDDGAGLPRDAVETLQNGIGVSTTRARLQDLFGADFRFEFHRLPQGVSVLVAVPWQVATESFEGERAHDQDAEMPDRGRRAAGEGTVGTVAHG